MQHQHLTLALAGADLPMGQSLANVAVSIPEKRDSLEEVGAIHLKAHRSLPHLLPCNEELQEHTTKSVVEGSLILLSDGMAGSQPAAVPGGHGAVARSQVQLAQQAPRLAPRSQGSGHCGRGGCPHGRVSLPPHE